jgi:hypothetical protein
MYDSNYFCFVTQRRFVPQPNPGEFNQLNDFILVGRFNLEHLHIQADSTTHLTSAEDRDLIPDTIKSRHDLWLALPLYRIAI